MSARPRLTKRLLPAQDRALRLGSSWVWSAEGLESVTSTVEQVQRGHRIVWGGRAAGVAAVMEAIRVPWIGPGRPRDRPDHILSEKGYSSKAIRVWLCRRGISHTIPERAGQIRNRARRGSRGGRTPAFAREAACKHRNAVERCHKRLKQWRGIAPATTRPPSPAKQPSLLHHS